MFSLLPLADEVHHLSGFVVLHTAGWMLTFTFELRQRRSSNSCYLSYIQTIEVTIPFLLQDARIALLGR